MKLYFKILLSVLFLLTLGACQNYDELELNPNVASENKIVPPSLILGRLTYDIYQGGGVVDKRKGYVYEGPWDQVHRWNQYVISNNVYYGGQNIYGWSTTATAYDMLKNVTKMEENAFKTLNLDVNSYSALGKFFRAYLFVWLTQRVGDIPVTEAGLGIANLTPKYDTQKDVYNKALELLEESNADLAQLISTVTPASALEGDILLGNNLKAWQKLVNTYKLRVLISLSKRANDTQELGIKEKFAAILNDPAKYPVMTGNADNLKFTFNAAYDNYPHYPKDGNNNYQNVGEAYLSLTRSTSDPRTFIAASPAPAELAKGKTVDDFSAYTGADISLSLSELSTNSAAGKYAFVNHNRYYSSLVGPEPYIIVGYPEMCFNIAEALNRGWAVGSASDYYLKGIKASLEFYNLKDGDVLSIGDLQSAKELGKVTVSVTNFLANSEVVYKGDNENGLKQILNQKYIALFQNSGWEAFYNQRRTGLPTSFVVSGSSLNTVGKVPMRWQYPLDEQVYNPTNYQEAIQRQYNGSDDLYSIMWLLK